MTQMRFRESYMPWERTANPLLVRAELGRTKPTVRDLPPDEHVYGDRVPYGPEDSNEVMYNWKNHKPTACSANQKDLIKANKSCVSNNLHTSQQFYEFRKTTSSMCKTKHGSRDIPLYLPADGFTYGKPLELEDPIRVVIGNGYGQDDALRRKTFYKTQQTMRSSGSRKLSCFITKSHQLVKEATREKLERLQWKPYKEQFKLSKFKNAQSKVDDKRPFSCHKEARTQNPEES